MKFSKWMPFVVLAMASGALCSDPVVIGAFSRSDVAGWEERVFQGHTNYALAEEDGKTVLSAHSQSTASSFYRRIDIDLRQTPILHWSWRVDQVFRDINEREKSGDDFPARLYLVFSDGSTFWKSRSLNYVWSSHQGVGAEWSNPYAASAQMIAVESGDKQLGRWQSYSRNVRDDFMNYFGDDVQQVRAVAVMTDTDDTGQAAASYYGDIYFSAQ